MATDWTKRPGNSDPSPRPAARRNDGSQACDQHLGPQPKRCSTEAAYMTAPIHTPNAPKKPLPARGRPYMTELRVFSSKVTYAMTPLLESGQSHREIRQILTMGRLSGDAKRNPESCVSGLVYGVGGKDAAWNPGRFCRPRSGLVSFPPCMFNLHSCTRLSAQTSHHRKRL